MYITHSRRRTASSSSSHGTQSADFESFLSRFFGSAQNQSTTDSANSFSFSTTFSVTATPIAPPTTTSPPPTILFFPGIALSTASALATPVGVPTTTDSTSLPSLTLIPFPTSTSSGSPHTSSGSAGSSTINGPAIIPSGISFTTRTSSLNNVTIIGVVAATLIALTCFIWVVIFFTRCRKQRKTAEEMKFMPRAFVPLIGQTSVDPVSRSDKPLSPGTEERRQTDAAKSNTQQQIAGPSPPVGPVVHTENLGHLSSTQRPSLVIDPTPSNDLAEEPYTTIAFINAHSSNGALTIPPSIIAALNRINNAGNLDPNASIFQVVPAAQRQTSLRLAEDPAPPYIDDRASTDLPSQEVEEKGGNTSVA